MSTTVCVVGLGKLGAPLAACLAAKGFHVLGVDADPVRIEAVSRGQPPVFEPGLEQVLRRAEGRLTATLDIKGAVAAADLTMILVPTPSEPAGGFSLRYVLPACEAVGRALAAKSEYHVVALTSTVMPGSTGGAVRLALEKASGKRCGTEFGLCYSPEFIALGSAIHDLLNPDFVLIGESDPRAGDALAALYEQLCDNSPAVARMNFMNAEITKLAVNTYVTTKISFANMLARMCERLPEANVDVITAALGLDSRIGPKYLKGAISYGGPCFPRDNHALAALAHHLGTPADIAQATDTFNRGQIRWLADLVQKNSSAGRTVGILGLTYKPGTNVVEEAVGLLLAQELAGRGIAVVAYDPAWGSDAGQGVGPQVRLAETAAECIQRADIVVLATPWPEFCSLPAEQWARNSPPRTVIDCWRVVKHLEHREGLRYISLGAGGGRQDTAPA